MPELLSFALLAAVLAAAVARPHGLPEAFVAVPAAAILVATGVVSLDALNTEWDRLRPVLIFLAAVLVLAHACSVEGLFDAAGSWLGQTSRGLGSRMLLHVFVLSAAVTCVLSLDATVVLLTPVVFASAAHVGIPARPHVYAAGRLANSGSLLLPMANLTNLLAVAASGLTLVHYAGLMMLPFLVVLIVEYVVVRSVFRADLALPPTEPDPDPPREIPWFAIAALVLTLIGFIATSFIRLEPYWIALAGAALLVGHAWSKRLTGGWRVVKAADVPFLLFVFGLAVVVRGVVDSGLGDWVAARVPDSTDLVALLGFALFGAVLANVVNNLPALLILLAPSAAVGPLAVLAVLIGVNIGPNLTYTGSLATLLWRRVLSERGLSPSLRTFTRLGVLTVPLGIVLAVVALWASAQLPLLAP